MSTLLELVRARRAELERVQQAKPRVTIVTSDEDRIKAVEALIARQRGGSPVLGDAERLKAVEAIFARAKERQRREADLGAAGSPVVSMVSKTRTSDAPDCIVERCCNGVSYHTIDHGPEPASKPEYIDSPPASSAGPWSASRLWPPPVPLQLQIPSHQFERSGRRAPRHPFG